MAYTQQYNHYGNNHFQKVTKIANYKYFMIETETKTKTETEAVQKELMVSVQCLQMN